MGHKKKVLSWVRTLPPESFERAYESAVDLADPREADVDSDYFYIV